MCGIVGAIAQRPVPRILIEGLRRLEYRGYDSAGIAMIDADQQLQCVKREGKVAVLNEAAVPVKQIGHIGIAHTRWATHGVPNEANAHPHLSNDSVAVVHNGIIENHDELRAALKAKGYNFVSDTDTEVIVHLLHDKMQQGLDILAAVKAAVPELEGAYGLAAIATAEPKRLVAARSGSPLVIGCGIGENFIASDYLALRQVTDKFVYLEEGDIAELTEQSYQLWNAKGEEVERPVEQLKDGDNVASKGKFRHYMMKETYEQPDVIKDTLQGRLGKNGVLEQTFGNEATAILDQVQAVQIVACGTSYHSGMVAKYWIEGLANVPTRVEVASEFRYRKFAVQPNTLLVTISQSGETADTLAALRMAKTLGYTSTMTICNVAQSSLARESDIVLLTKAGPEIGVASTKAFTTQLVCLLMLTEALGRRHGMTAENQAMILDGLKALPDLLTETLKLDPEIEKMSELYSDKHHALFLGRGSQYPVAMEGALKLKEISYIHAEAYPAGELKHGPLALVDANMPIVAVAPNDELLEKLKSNLEEVQARGGQLYVFADKNSGFKNDENVYVLNVPHVNEVIAPIVYTIPLQLLSYYVAIIKGTDVDQPRNLAKSVTVE